MTVPDLIVVLEEVSKITKVIEFHPVGAHLSQNQKCHDHGRATGKVSEFSKSLGLILGAP